DLNRGSSKRLVKLKEAHNQLEDRIKKINRKIRKLRKKSDDNKTDEVIRTGNGKFYALIIGVSSYIDNRLNLDQPTKDAETLRQLLVNDYSFDEKDVTLLLDPPRQEILKAMFAFRKKLTQRDNLLVFYAGHGYWDEEASQGYWWPVDATPDDPSFWLSNSDIREQLRGIKSAHSLVISDACFSGGILRTRNADEIRDAPTDIILLYKQPSRRAITSGNLSAVPDKSVFFEFLKKKLEDNEEKYLPSQVLFDNIRKSVINNSLILPQDGVITDTGDQGGDFIFIRKKSKREN
ncbi:MAG: caspase family protein, partial [Cyclobacteriaceae bacterium]